MFSKMHSMGLFGIEAFPIEIEADISSGMPCFDLVGLPDAAVKESRDRVRSALKNCGYDYPVARITVNLAPADLKKEGPLYDLPILLALMCATKQLSPSFDDSVFIGELSLSGELRPVKGILPMAITAKQFGFTKIFVPKENAPEAAVVEGIEAYGAESLKQLLNHLCGMEPMQPEPAANSERIQSQDFLDFSDVKGQNEAKRGLEIAAAGLHNILLIGPPGSGKSMLAKRLPSILPDMSFEEIIETTKIHSIAGILPNGSGLVRTRSFRSPHHTVSPAGLSGGGGIPRPGELSLAHNGVLFLDELPEFSRNAMEVLRQPIEDGTVTISRVSGSVSYPCSVMVVAAMNPCPCGYFGHPTKQCTCSAGAVSRYLGRVSGPLLDRLDLHVEVPPVEFDALSSKEKSEPSAAIKERVNRARARQAQRFSGTSITCNARIPPDLLGEVCRLSGPTRQLLKSAFERLGLSARAYDRVLKVSRTIADLEDCEDILPRHAAEAVQYRSLDRKYWTREL